MKIKTKIPVAREILADMETPLSVFRKLSNGPYSYLFESVEGGENWARYSLIGLEASKVILSSLKDPAEDKDRVQQEEWLVLEGVCTHLGCVPLGQKMSDTKGEYNGWFCPCHGSHYDSSGRIRKGPAPTNLAVPPYQFLNENLIKIG